MDQPEVALKVERSVLLSGNWLPNFLLSAIMTESLIKRAIKSILRRDPIFAADFYRKEVAQRERLYGSDDERTLVSRSNYALALHQCGESVAGEAELAALIERQGKDWNPEEGVRA